MMASAIQSFHQDFSGKQVQSDGFTCHFPTFTLKKQVWLLQDYLELAEELQGNLFDSRTINKDGIDQLIA